MERDTKLGYGFLFFGAAMQYLIDAFFKSPLAALIVAIVLAVAGVLFLVSGHLHPSPDRLISGRRKLFTWILVVAVIGGILYEGWNVMKQHGKEGGSHIGTGTATATPSVRAAVPPPAQFPRENRQPEKRGLSPTLPPPVNMYMTKYGTTAQTSQEIVADTAGNVISGTASSDIEAAGYLLMKYAAQYKLVAVCFHWDGREDFKDVAGISKSAVYDIREAPIPIRLDWNKKFVLEVVKNHARQTNYALLLVPNKVRRDSFSSIREALKKGAYILQTGGGPP